jgi:quercetin dioxygenase-like cupin family protein
MITSIHSFGGVTATVYVMNKGEKITRHEHTFAHTTAVASGQSEIEIYAIPNLTFTMLPGDPVAVLPPDIEHEIRALVDGTVVVNMSVGVSATDYVAPASGGGVALHDGTVVDAS